jgi:hypothetical protein
MVPGLVASFASLGLHGATLLYPLLMLDDFTLLLESWTWPAAWDHLWLPHNEHTMPLGRLSTRALVELGGGRLTAMPALAALQGPLAVVAGMWLIYLLVRRETGQPLHGLLAMTIFGVSGQYTQAVTWFAASFAVLALDTTLLALLAAQRWRQTGQRGSLVWCVIWVALAPAWFATGILAGPLCCLYLLPERWWLTKQTPAPQGRHSRLVSPSSAWLTLIPLLGSLLFVGVLLTRPDTAGRIVHSGHYGNQTVFEVFNPLNSAIYTSRAIWDRLVLGTLGIWTGPVPVALVVVGLAVLVGVGAWSWRRAPSLRLPVLGSGLILGNGLLAYASGAKGASPLALVVVGLTVLVVLAAWWWRRAPDRRLLVLGLGFILGNNLLIYSFRTPWGYEAIVFWSRYDLLPHAGLTLFVVGGLPVWRGGFPGSHDVVLSRRQALGVCLLAGILFATQWLRGGASNFASNHAGQMAALRHIEDLDARCREFRIAAATAHEALGHLESPLNDGVGAGWKFLRGSDDPVPLTVEEARRLLGK